MNKMSTFWHGDNRKAGDPSASLLLTSETASECDFDKCRRCSSQSLKSAVAYKSFNSFVPFDFLEFSLCSCSQAEHQKTLISLKTENTVLHFPPFPSNEKKLASADIQQIDLSN